MQLCLCVSGSVIQSCNFVNFSLPQLLSENVSSVERTLWSRIKTCGVRSLHSKSDNLVAESIDAIGRPDELGAVNTCELWDGYRESVLERIGFNVGGIYVRDFVFI